MKTGILEKSIALLVACGAAVGAVNMGLVGRSMTELSLLAHLSLTFGAAVASIFIFMRKRAALDAYFFGYLAFICINSLPLTWQLSFLGARVWWILLGDLIVFGIPLFLILIASRNGSGRSLIFKRGSSGAST